MRVQSKGRYGVAGWFRKAVLGVFTSMTLTSVAFAAPITIVALGDSLTHGFGLPQEDGFVPQLQTWLRENGAEGVVVKNAGVSGDTTAGGLARFEWSLAEGGDAVIVELGGNDLLRGIDPVSSRQNLTGIMQKAAERSLPVLLTGMQAPINYGPEYKEAFDAMYPELAAEYQAIYDPFFLEGMIDRPELFQDDGIHPNQDGVAFLVGRFGPLALELVRQAETRQQ